MTVRRTLVAPGREREGQRDEHGRIAPSDRASDASGRLRACSIDPDGVPATAVGSTWLAA